MKLVDIDRVVQQIDPFERESEPVVGAPLHILADGDQPFTSEMRRPKVHQPRQAAFQRTYRRAVIPGVRFVIRVMNRADHRYPAETPGYPADHIRGPEMSMNQIGLITSQNPPQPLNAFRQVAQVPAAETRHLDAELLDQLNDAHNLGAKSGQATLRHRYSTARVSKRQTHRSAACLRARYCTDLACSDLVESQMVIQPSHRPA